MKKIGGEIYVEYVGIELSSVRGVRCRAQGCAFLLVRVTHSSLVCSSTQLCYAVWDGRVEGLCLTSGMVGGCVA